jgi:hypothetical protein
VLGQAGRSRYDTENVGAFAGELVRGRKYNLCETAALAKKTIEAMGYDEQQAGVFASALGETLNYNIHQSGEFIIILTHGWGIEQKARFVAEFARGEKKDVAAILEWLIIAERKISALFSAGHEKAGRFPNVATAMAATGLKNPDDVQREFFALGFEAGRGATKKAEEGKNWEGKDLRWWGRFVAHLAEEERYDEGPTRNLIVKAMGLISTWGEEEAGGFLAGAIKARKGDERQMGKSAARIIDKTTLDFDQDAPYIVGFIAAEKYEEEQSIAFIEGWVKGMVYDEKQTGRLAAGVAESKAYNKREEILFAARLAIGLGYNQKQTAKFVAGVLEERGDNSGAEAERFIADFAKEKGWGEKETTKFAALIEKETPADAFSTGVFIANLARARKLSERGTGKLVADFSAAKGGRRKEEYDLAIFVAGEKQYSEKQTAAFSASMAIESGYNEQRVRELAEHIAAHRKYGLESFYGEILKKINDFFNEDKTGELYLSWLIGGTT